MGLERRLPRADLRVFLDLSEAVAFSRKNDIQSVCYLRERKEHYLQFTPVYGFKLVNADQSADAVHAAVKALAQEVLPPPNTP